PYIVADQNDRVFDPELPDQQPVDVVRHGLLVITGSRAPRVPRTAVIGATTRKPAAASAGMTWRHCHHVCGKPCKSTMVRAPCPVATKRIRRPGSTSAIACETILASSSAAKLASSAS